MWSGVNMGTVTTSTAARSSYHHGDLRNALARAAADLAASGGPDAVTIRGAARAVGVTPTAAYRHFANQADLLLAAKELAMAGMTAAIADYLSQVPAEGDPIDLAIARLLSTGRGYIRFAIAEPGVFLTCFTGHMHRPEGSGPDLSGRAPYALLGEMLDQLVEVGYLAPEDRPGAEAGPWAAVHGLAMLLIDGPLRGSTPAEQESAIERTLDLTVHGLATGPKAGRRRDP
jgi:AcrR family transcriptional regulator